MTKLTFLELLSLLSRNQHTFKTLSLPPVTLARSRSEALVARVGAIAAPKAECCSETLDPFVSNDVT